VRSETRTIYVARDGEEFLSEAQCRAHERRTSGDALVGLTAAQVEAARTGDDPELAEAFRMFVNEMRNFKRRAPANNGGENAGPPLSDDAGNGRAADSANRTNKERAGALQGEGIGLEDGRTEAAPVVDDGSREPAQRARSAGGTVRTIGVGDFDQMGNLK
jgi:hypothetical protein